MKGNQLVIDFALDTNWNDLPEVVQHQSKRALLDNLGVLIAGGMTPASQIALEFVADQMAASGSLPACTVVSTGMKVSAVGAALANGTAANGLDMDDGYNPAKGHPGAALLPVLLAASELAPDISGQDFLTTLVVGYELAMRAAMIRHATYTTYHSSGSWGAIGGAAAGGRLLGLNSGQLGHAMGVAEYFAPIAPMMKGIDVVAMTKDSINWGALVAMSSILMARKGFTGVNPIYDDGPGPSLTRGLGIEPLEDKEIQKDFPAKRQARVEIVAEDGRVFDSGVVNAPWGVATDRPTDQELIDKFMTVTDPVLGENCAKELLDVIWNFEKEPLAVRLIDLATVTGA